MSVWPELPVFALQTLQVEWGSSERMQDLRLWLWAFLGRSPQFWPDMPEPKSVRLSGDKRKPWTDYARAP